MHHRQPRPALPDGHLAALRHPGKQQPADAGDGGGHNPGDLPGMAGPADSDSQPSNGPPAAAATICRAASTRPRMPAEPVIVSTSQFSPGGLTCGKNRERALRETR